MQDCTLRLDVCNYDPETTVFCHIKSPDNGMGLKQSKDFWGVFACSNCHDVLDRRQPTKMGIHLILERVIAGLYETQKVLQIRGLMSYDDG